LTRTLPSDANVHHWARSSRQPRRTTRTPSPLPPLAHSPVSLPTSCFAPAGRTGADGFSGSFDVPALGVGVDGRVTDEDGGLAVGVGVAGAPGLAGVPRSRPSRA